MALPSRHWMPMLLHPKVGVFCLGVVPTKKQWKLGCDVVRKVEGNFLGVQNPEAYWRAKDHVPNHN